MSDEPETQTTTEEPQPDPAEIARLDAERAARIAEIVRIADESDAELQAKCVQVVAELNDRLEPLFAEWQGKFEARLATLQPLASQGLLTQSEATHLQTLLENRHRAAAATLAQIGK